MLLSSQRQGANRNSTAKEIDSLGDVVAHLRLSGSTARGTRSRTASRSPARRCSSSTTGVDTGPIVAQVAVPVEDDDDVERLHERIKAAERPMLVDVVGRMAREGFTVTDRKVTIP